MRCDVEKHVGEYLTRERKALIKALVSAIGLAYLLSWQTVSMWPILAFIMLFYIYKKYNCEDKWQRGWAGCVAVVFSLFCVLGKYELFGGTAEGIQKLIFIAIGMFFLFHWIVSYLYGAMDQLSVEKWEPKRKKNRFVIMWATILLCWLPYYIRYYPGVFTRDSIIQIRQVLGLDGYTNYHPFAHTFIIKFIHHFVKLFVAEEATAFGIVMFIQMILLSCVFAVVVYTIYRNTRNKKMWMLAWAFYALVPYNGIYSVSLWKDVWFGGICVAFLLLLNQYCMKDTGIKKGKMYLYLFGIGLSGIGVCLFRNNGYYAFFAFLLLSVVMLFVMKNKDVKLLATLLITFILATVILGPGYKMAGVQSGDSAAKLAIPSQNIAAVIASGAELKDEEYELLNKIIDVDKVADAYIPWLADPVKDLIREKGNQPYLNEHKGEYVKLWITLGLRYPREYLVSWINQTKGYWYPDIGYWVYMENIYENDIGIVKIDILSESAQEMLKAWTDSYQKIPVYGILWEVGAFVWTLLLMLGYVISRKQWDLIGIYVFLGSIWGTLLIATPVYAEFRYLYAIIAATPFFVTVPFFKKENVAKK